MIDPAQIDREKARLKTQVAGLVRKYAVNNVNALAVVAKAEGIFRARVAAYDSPAEARSFAVRAIARQLSGKPTSYQDITDSHFALGDQANVRTIVPAGGNGA